MKQENAMNSANRHLRILSVLSVIIELSNLILGLINTLIMSAP